MHTVCGHSTAVSQSHFPLSHTEFWQGQFCWPCCASAPPFGDLVLLTWPKVTVNLKSAFKLWTKIQRNAEKTHFNLGVEYKQRLEGTIWCHTGLPMSSAVGHCLSPYWVTLGLTQQCHSQVLIEANLEISLSILNIWLTCSSLQGPEKHLKL